MSDPNILDELQTIHDNGQCDEDCMFPHQDEPTALEREDTRLDDESLLSLAEAEYHAEKSLKDLMNLLRTSKARI